LEGTLALFFGVTAIFWPGLTLLTLVYLFSAFVLATSIVQIVIGLTSLRSSDTWWLPLLTGLVLLGAGVYLVRHPNVSFATFILVIGLTFLARGVLDLVNAFADRQARSQRALRVIAGVAALVAGVIILLQPVAGGVAFVWILGLYAIIFGSLTIAGALGLRYEVERLLSELSTQSAGRRSGRSTTPRKRPA
jgi:uncharacterized membrane protein HdeD (DUF308 family)